MDLTRVLKKHYQHFNQARKHQEDESRGKGHLSVARNSSGIALFMVLASLSVLTILVTEFVYIAQISQMIAFGGLDQTKAHYLAKSGLKLALLRLKAYQQVKKQIGALTAAAGAAGANMIPKGMIEKIWSFPFFFPIPTNIPGMNTSDKEAIEKFQKDSAMDGKFSINIESESSKYNLNSIVASYMPSPVPSSSPSPGAPNQPPAAPGAPTPPTGQTPANPNPTSTFDPVQARQGLATFFNNMIMQKSEADPDFAQNYRDFRINDFVDVLSAWTDRTYQRMTGNNLDKVPMKYAPFYSVSELHMLPLIDDELYNLFAPALTVSRTSGVNVNMMQEGTLRALAPAMSKDEVTEFFKYRDSTESDNYFRNSDGFFTYLANHVAAYQNQQALANLKTDLNNKHVQIITDEDNFKITVHAESGTAARTIEAWVTLGTPSQTSSVNSPQPTGAPAPAPGTQPLAGPGPGPTTATNQNSTGLKITFMKMY